MYVYHLNWCFAACNEYSCLWAWGQVKLVYLKHQTNIYQIFRTNVLAICIYLYRCSLAWTQTPKSEAIFVYFSEFVYLFLIYPRLVFGLGFAPRFLAKTRWSPRTRMPTRMLRNRDWILICHNFQRTLLWNTLTWHTWADSLVGHPCLTLLRYALVRHSCLRLWFDTLACHSCKTLLLETLVRLFLLDTLTRHSCKTLLLNTLVGHFVLGTSYLTLFWDTLTWHSCETFLLDSHSSPALLLDTSSPTLLIDTLVKYSYLTLLAWHFFSDTLAWHSCKTLLLDTLVRHSCTTLLLDTLVKHSYLTLLLRHSYLTLL